MKRAVVIPVLFFAAVLAVWQGAVDILAIPEYLLPAPSVILGGVDTDLAVAFGYTASEAIGGFVLASLLAFGAALLFVRFQTLEQGLFPLAIMLKTTPIVAIAPLLVLWLGTGWWSKVAAAMLICFFPVLVNTVKGLKAAEQDYHDLFQSFAASPWQEFRKLRIPFCLPYLFSALKISSSLAIVGAIVGEFVGAEHGLGYLIMISSAHLETATVFQAIFAAAFAGIILFNLVGWFEKRVVFWSRMELE